MDTRWKLLDWEFVCQQSPKIQRVWRSTMLLEPWIDWVIFFSDDVNVERTLGPYAQE
jgi:hypothetical protein